MPASKINFEKDLAENINLQDSRLLKAVELIMEKPANIKQKALSRLGKEKLKAGYSSEISSLQKSLSINIVNEYSKYSGIAGGATSFTSIIPGLGTAISLLGGFTADLALSMKYQVEMVMTIATIYGKDIEDENEKNLCYLIAGLAVLNEYEPESVYSSFTKMIQKLRNTALNSVKYIFSKLSALLLKKALGKTIPFGIGIALSFNINKNLTKKIGYQAIDYYTN